MKPASLFVAVILAACSKHDASLPDSSGAATPANQTPSPPAAPSASATSSPPCPGTGKWAICNVERRLKQSGFVVTPVEESPDRAGFSVKPKVYRLGKARLEVFLYDSEAAVAHDVAGLDTVTAAPKGAASPWEMQPVFMRSQNLAAVLLTGNARQAERVVLAITAGAPQPGSPR